MPVYWLKFTVSPEASSLEESSKKVEAAARVAIVTLMSKREVNMAGRYWSHITHVTHHTRHTLVFSLSLTHAYTQRQNNTRPVIGSEVKFIKANTCKTIKSGRFTVSLCYTGGAI